MVIFDKCKVCRKQFNHYILCKNQIKVVSFKKCYNICDMSCTYGRYKNLILFLIYFNKDIKFAIVELVHRSTRVLHHVCLQQQSYTFWR